MMRKLLAAAALSVALAGCTGMMGANAPEPSLIGAAVAAETRPAADRERDAARKPADMLAFAHVSPGDRVAELIPAGGYFTRLLAGAVGAEGRVYAVIPPPGGQFNWAEMIAPAAAAHANVTVLTQLPTQLAPPEPVDLVFTAQNYHDMHIARYGLDAAQVNAAAFNALKPGGVYLVIDHSAVVGSDLTVPEALHRIDQAIVRREAEAAGFVYDGEENSIRNAADPRTASVFDPSIRGHTDQFVMRFRKPG